MVAGDRVLSVGYATWFPSPRTERVSPGHLVALAAHEDAEVVVWRWYDAVVVGEEPGGRLRLWEPAHGEMVAHPRRQQPRPAPGTRVLASAGLPGADWWVAGPVTPRVEDADVELDEVARFLVEQGLWTRSGVTTGRRGDTPAPVPDR